MDKIPLIRSGYRGVGMDHIPVGGEGTDLQSVTGHRVQKLAAFGFVRQQLFCVTVSISGVSAAADFHHLHTFVC